MYILLSFYNMIFLILIWYLVSFVANFVTIDIYCSQKTRPPRREERNVYPMNHHHPTTPDELKWTHTELSQVHIYPIGFECVIHLRLQTGLSSSSSSPNLTMTCVSACWQMLPDQPRSAPDINHLHYWRYVQMQ